MIRPVPAPIDRATAQDEVTLATDVGPAPMHAGAVLVFAGHEGPTLDALLRALEERIPTVPRLRRRLVRPPWGAGRAVWIDDQDVDLARQVRTVTCAAPGEEAQLLDLVTEALAEPLPIDRPRWRAVLVTGLSEDRSALVLVMHHVLADGIGGLAVLANLVDGQPEPPDSPQPPDRPEPPDPRDAPEPRTARGPQHADPPTGADRGGPGFPAPPPSARELRLDAAARRRAALASLPATVAQSLAALRTLPRPSLRASLQSTRPRGGTRPRQSLLAPTGARRRFGVVRVDLDRVRRAARACGATVNDLVLVAVGSALGDTLSAQGESPTELVVSVPVSARTTTSADHLGNQVGAVPVRVPLTGEPTSRVQAVAAATRRAKEGPRGASASLLGPCFRVLAAIGLFRPFIEHQHVVDTFVTNLRGPDTPMTLAGARVDRVIPFAAVPGNVLVSFAVLSYAGCLGITITTDASSWLDPAQLQGRLAAELERLLDDPPRHVRLAPDEP